MIGSDAPGWFALKNSHAGLNVINTNRSFCTPLTAQILIYAGFYVTQIAKGGRLAVGDISGPQPGKFDPHLSHQKGEDADVSYILNGKYPTPIETPISPEWIAMVHAIAPWLTVIFMSNARIAEFKKIAPLAPLQPIVPVNLKNWAGHQKHAHLRFVPSQINAFPDPELPP